MSKWGGEAVARNAIDEMRHHVGEEHSSEETDDVVVPGQSGFPLELAPQRNDLPGCCVDPNSGDFRYRQQTQLLINWPHDRPDL